jgi:hypothetical protein
VSAYNIKVDSESIDNRKLQAQTFDLNGGALKRITNYRHKTNVSDYSLNAYSRVMNITLFCTKVMPENCQILSEFVTVFSFECSRDIIHQFIKTSRQTLLLVRGLY